MVILYILLVFAAVILARTLMFTPPKEEQKVFEEEKALFTKKLEEILEALKDCEVNDTKKYPGEE